MQILTLENEALDLNTLPDQIEEDIRFSVLDNSDSNNPDFFYIPLIFLESFKLGTWLWASIKNNSSDKILFE